LTTLDVSENTALLLLDCDDNQLASLNVSNQTVLKILSCSGNQLTSLDLSKNSSIGKDVGSELTYYSKYYYCYLSIEEMPGLEKVCVWTMPFSPEGVKLCAEGSPNVYFTADCSK
jgi:hypothetical protein